MYKIIYTRVDGGVSIVHAVPKEELPLTFLTEEAYKQFVWERSVPSDAINPVEIQTDNIPSNKEFRYAWKQDGNNITYDLEKAKTIQVERTELAINSALQSLNAELIEAIVSGNDEEKESIIAKKENLKNSMNALIALVPESIEQIKSATPNLEAL